MTTSAKRASVPRKVPVQARAAETVEAICEAAIQLLLKSGPAQLTTIRIAKRAGVSVGTYYQYFPNKEALLLTLLGQHLRRVTKAVELSCHASHGQPLRTMVATLLEAYLQAQLKHRDAARALYRMAPDLAAGATLSRERRLVVTAIADMLRTSPDLPEGDLDLIAFTFFGAIAGATRAVLETSVGSRLIVGWEKHLERLGQAYLESFHRSA